MNIIDVSKFDVIITNFRKSFNTISHDLLISQLNRLGIGNPLLSWIKNYITGMEKYVFILGSSSDIFEATPGVPQGGHL